MASPPSTSPAAPARPPGYLSAGCIAGLAVGIASLFLCAGVISVGVYGLSNPTVLPPSLQQAVENSSLMRPIAQPSFDGNDWWTQRVLSQVYTVALDVVVADPQVIERLGDDIETDLTAEDLYHRINTGPLDGNAETIEFDLVGTKDRGTVKVVIGGAAMPAGVGDEQLRFREITMTLSDGSTITIPNPADQALQIR